MGERIGFSGRYYVSWESIAHDTEHGDLSIDRNHLDDMLLLDLVQDWINGIDEIIRMLHEIERENGEFESGETLEIQIDSVNSFW